MLLGPVVHLWYLLWVVPFDAALRTSRIGLAAVLAVSTVAGLVAPLDSSLHGAYLAIVLGSMLVACLVPVLLLTPQARARIEKIVSAQWLPDPELPRPRDVGFRGSSQTRSASTTEATSAAPFSDPGAGPREQVA